MKDIADLVIEEIKRAGFDKKLPYGIVLTGGGANLEGIAEAFTTHTGIDTRIGVPDVVVDEDSAEKIDGPEFATVTGLLWNALQSGAYCMVDQRPQPAFVPPVAPTPQPAAPRFTPPVPPTPPTPQAPATPTISTPQPAKPQTINERYGAQQQTVATPAPAPAPAPEVKPAQPASVPPVVPTPAPAPVVDPEPAEEESAPKPQKGGWWKKVTDLAEKATKKLEEMGGGNNDDDII